MTDKVRDFYDGNAEKEWLRLALHRMELAVSLRALAEYLPAPPARVVDIGSGPGRYAIELSRRGYDVTLVDLANENLEYAKGKAEEAAVHLAACVRADALCLPELPGAPYDAALIMGPFYHLLERSEREEALTQARNVLAPRGLVFAAFIGRYAGLRWSAKYAPRWMIDDARARALLEEGRNIIEPGGGFIDSYFERVEAIVPFMESGGFETLGLLSCEGAVSMIDEGINELEGPDWDAWVALNYRLASDPSVHGTAEHLLYIGRNRTHFSTPSRVAASL